ncbi:MAG TPA: hybrid sensor histidine kinase/response regulator [Polyangiales bacterium]|nr:hybrid sensor histidine kinase/response regulator [Polyangiales bacterium]
MDRDKLIQRLRATFSSELREHVEAFNRELLSLERGGNDAARAESIKTLFRTAHSLKGAARAVNAGKLELVCHNLEEVLQGLRDGSRQLTPEIFETLFRAVDSFEEAGREINASLPAPPEAPPGMPKPRSGSPPLPPSKQPEPPRAAATPVPKTSGTSRTEPPPSAAASPRTAATASELAPPPATSISPTTPAPAASTTASAAAPNTSAPSTLTSSSLPASVISQVPGPAAAPHLSLPPPVSLPAGTGNDSPATATPASLETFLRVPEHKLDALLACNSELLIARRRFDGRHAELAALNERMSELRASSERAARAKTQRVGPSRSRGTAAVRFQPAAIGTAIDPQREQVVALERALESYSAALAEDFRTLERAAESLDERIHQVRMLPFAQACDALHRTVRDLAARERKPTELVIRGGEIELDRSIIDGLRAPLLHLVRNAVDHGIENADERNSASKPPRATITIAAALRGDRVEVSVRDDGRGIDLDRIRERLRLNGMPSATDDQDALRMIFEAGFSTAPSVTDVSGRGVGLDVVRSQVEGLRGSVGVTYESGRFTCFSMLLPLTVTTLRALLIRAGSEIFALPSTNVEKLLRAGASELAQLQGRETLLTNEAPLPLVALAEIVGAETSPPMAAQGKLPIVILGQPGERIALAVDELITEQDVVVKTLGKRIRKLRHVSGATLLPNGRVALLLHTGEILRTALGRVPARRAGGIFQATEQPSRKQILLVDDSSTTRTLEKSILEAAGFEITTAVDGAQAWQILQEQGADLVVSDVEMPNMTGFELAQNIRGSKRFRELPIILLTSLDSEQDRARGLESGADAYLVKSAFDQSNLLETIRQLL